MLNKRHERMCDKIEWRIIAKYLVTDVSYFIQQDKGFKYITTKFIKQIVSSSITLNERLIFYDRG